jgi:hypothetical protein
VLELEMWAGHTMLEAVCTFEVLVNVHHIPFFSFPPMEMNNSLIDAVLTSGGRECMGEELVGIGTTVQPTQ